jgi:hypothetical protein
MLPRLIPLFLLAAALALPATAGATTVRLDTAPGAGSFPDAPRALLREAEAIAAGDERARGGELTLLLKELAVALPELEGAERARAIDLLERPTMGEGTRADDGEYTVEEETPLCSEHFCVHYVATTKDKPASLGYVEMMNAVFENVYAAENVQMGWRPPKSDGARGCPGRADFCMDKTDVYVKDIGSRGLYGYAAPDPGQDEFQQHAYLVLDNDYSEEIFTRDYPEGPTEPVQVTAAHEYNHVLQFAYSVVQETWMYEATASWIEEKVYPDINDYFQYMPSWAQLSNLPLTHEDVSGDFVGKTYGNAVWNQWIDTTFGQQAILSAWDNVLDVRPRGFSPAAYGKAFQAGGSDWFRAFTGFAADTAEWRASNSPFDAEDHSLLPDVRRVRDERNRQFRLVANGPGGVAPLLHSAYALVEVAPSDAPRIKLVGNLPRGARGAIALIGRTGDAVGGTYVVEMKRMRRGGTRKVVLENPSQYSRITAALINGDSRQKGRAFGSDWNWVGDRDTDGDGVEDTGPAFTTLLSTDFDSPSLNHRSPSRSKKGVSRRAPVKVRFSEAMMFANKRTAVLLGPGSKKVKARVEADGDKLALRPRSRLRPRTWYEVVLSSDITDRGGNPIPAASRFWDFRTGRR